MPKSQQDFTFIALGDDRPAGAGLPPTATYREILKEVALIDPAFVISTGDLLYGNEETLAQYKQEIAWMKPLLNALPCPFINVPGNHEINNRPEFLRAYEKGLGPLYGRFDFGSFRFLAVCTELPADKPSVFGAQLEWLKGQMSHPMPTIAFEHHPVFTRASNKEDTAGVSNHDELHKLYQSGGVKAVFEGHDHVYNRQEHDGILYMIAGGAGAPLDAEPTDGGFFHYVIVHVHGDSLEATPVSIGALEVVKLSESRVAVGNYCDTDLPVNRLVIQTRKRPSKVSAGYGTKTGKTKKVPAKIVSVSPGARGFDVIVALVAPKHHATIVRLQ